MKKGQTILSVVMWGVGISVPVLVGVYAFANAMYEKNIEDHSVIRQEVGSQLAEAQSKVAVMQNDLDYLGRDLAEVKADIKSMLKAFNIEKVNTYYATSTR